MKEVNEIEELSKGRTFHINKDLPNFAEKLMELKLKNKKDAIGTIEKENSANDLKKMSANKQKINLTGNYARNNYYTNPDEPKDNKIQELEDKVKKLESFVKALNNQLTNIATQINENPGDKILAQDRPKTSKKQSLRLTKAEEIIRLNRSGNHSSAILKMSEFIKRHVPAANDELEANLLVAFSDSVAKNNVNFLY